jgi:hypothetical protein
MAISIPIISTFSAKGIKQAKAEFQKLEGVGAKTGFVLSKAAMGATAAFAGLAAGAAAVGGFLVGAARAAGEDQKSVALLDKQIRRLTGATDEQMASVEKMISGFQMATGIADDELRPSFAQLVRASGSVERAQKLMEAGLDISAGTGKDLATVIMALSKAEGGNLKSLKRLGIPMGKMTEAQQELADVTKKLTKEQEKYDLALMEKDQAGAERHLKKINTLQTIQNELVAQGADYLKDVTDVFGGQAAVAADTFEGKLARLGTRFDEFKEDIGKKILPYLERFLEMLIDVADAFGEGGISGAWEELKRQFAQAGFEQSPVGNFFRSMYDGVRTVYNALVDLYNLSMRLSGAKMLSDISGFFGGPTLPSPGKMPEFGTFFEANVPTTSSSAQFRMRESGTVPQSVVINVSGGDPNAVVDALRRYSRQNGGISGVRLS